jgi:phospholipid/cholesterol/gamma-HCH transport system substrate-binding protein
MKKLIAVRTLLGVVTALLIAVVITSAVIGFRGGLRDSAPITVVSQRAGLVMNPDAKVKLHGVQIGRVESIEALPDGRAALHLSVDRSQLDLIPANTLVDIDSTTVFGAKSVELVAPSNPSPKALAAGQTLDANHVMVESNTVFQQLNQVLGSVEPAKLSQTLTALAQGLSGRGKQLGQTLHDSNALLATIEPSLPALSHDLQTAPAMINAYADGAPDLIQTVQAATEISQTLVDEQHNLDRLLISAIGLADVGSDVVGTNRQPLTDVLHLLAPTTDLTNEYHENLGCGLAGVGVMAKSPPMPDPGAAISVSFTLGIERYRYPANLPKVAAKSPPTCGSQRLPDVPPETSPPFLVTDVGANQSQYGNQGILLNSDGLKQMLFGPLDGPPRNTAQIGQPG